MIFNFDSLQEGLEAQKGELVRLLGGADPGMKEGYLLMRERGATSLGELLTMVAHYHGRRNPTLADQFILMEVLWMVHKLGASPAPAVPEPDFGPFSFYRTGRAQRVRAVFTQPTRRAVQQLVIAGGIGGGEVFI